MGCQKRQLSIRRNRGLRQKTAGPRHKNRLHENENSGKYLDVKAVNFTASKHLIQYTGNGQSNQKFDMNFKTATKFKINPMNGQKLTAGSNEKGELVLDAADKWTQIYTLFKKGKAYLIKSNDGKCLDDSNSNTRPLLKYNQCRTSLRRNLSLPQKLVCIGSNPAIVISPPLPKALPHFPGPGT
jgi:hypothetical protein